MYFRVPSTAVKWFVNQHIPKEKHKTATHLETFQSICIKIQTHRCKEKRMVNAQNGKLFIG